MNAPLMDDWEYGWTESYLLSQSHCLEEKWFLTYTREIDKRKGEKKKKRKSEDSSYEEE